MRTNRKVTAARRDATGNRREAQGNARSLRGLAVMMVAGGCMFGATSAQAVDIEPGDVLPDAVSYESFGLNFAINERSSNAVGTLDYSGQPGCGGLCVATTTLGTDPSASLTVNEVTYELTAGGNAEAALGYYVALLNTPGTYAVDLHALDSFDITDGVYAYTNLRIGIAGTETTSFNNFVSTDFAETQCFNGCPSSTPAGATSQFFPADVQIQMQANTLYFVQLDALIAAGATGVDDTASVDPTFTSSDGGTFVFSPGVSSPVSVSPVPEPDAWAMVVPGFALIAAAVRRRGGSSRSRPRGAAAPS